MKTRDDRPLVPSVCQASPIVVRGQCRMSSPCRVVAAAHAGGASGLSLGPDTIADLPDRPLRDVLSRLLMSERRDRHAGLCVLAAVAKGASEVAINHTC